MKHRNFARLAGVALGALSVLGVLAGVPVSSAGAAARDKATALFEFDAASGYPPGAGVVKGSDGTLYGSTTAGGAGACGGGAGCGTVYALHPPRAGSDTWRFEKLYDFQDGEDGGSPTAPLTIGPAGELYGYTASGTPGTVFRLQPPARKGGDWQFDVLYVFRNASDGNLQGLHSPLVLNKDEVIGVAAGGKDGCGGKGCGSIFGVKQQHDGTWSELTVHRFSGGDDSGLPNWIAAGGKKSPVVASMSLGHGAVVAMIPPDGIHGFKWQLRKIATFAGGDDGQHPTNIVADAKGTLYGIADTGSGGMVFSLDPPGFFGTKWRRSTIARIDEHGQGPLSLSLGPNGSLVGAVEGDADSVAGSIFQLTPAGRGRWSSSTLWDFDRGPDRDPLDAIPGVDGALYGVLQGGDSSHGAVFELK